MKAINQQEHAPTNACVQNIERATRLVLVDSRTSTLANVFRFCLPCCRDQGWDALRFTRLSQDAFIFHLPSRRDQSGRDLFQIGILSAVLDITIADESNFILSEAFISSLLPSFL